MYIYPDCAATAGDTFWTLNLARHGGALPRHLVDDGALSFEQYSLECSRQEELVNGLSRNPTLKVGVPAPLQAQPTADVRQSMIAIE